MIYEVIADKTLSFGCKIEYCEDWYTYSLTTFLRAKYGKKHYIYVEPWRWKTHSNPFTKRINPKHITKIIWHPVMIGDVLDWIQQKRWSFFENNYPIEEVCALLEGNWYNEKVIRWNKRLSIDDQTDECIDYIYSLIATDSLYK